MTTKQNEKSKVTFTYKSQPVTTNNEFEYSILLQRQPGALPDNFSLSIHYPEGYQPENVKNFDKEAQKIDFKFSLKEDIFYKIRFKQVN